MNDSDLDDEGGYEAEEYLCSKCGKVFYFRYQDTGGIGYDTGHDRCPVCGKHFCDTCAQWHTYGDRHEKLCLNCFNKEILYDFIDWYDIFENEYCDTQCDDCPFFFKKGCVMMQLRDLVNVAFHTEEIKRNELDRLQKRRQKMKSNELDRLQKRNQETVKLWEDELRQAGVKPSKNKRSL